MSRDKKDARNKENPSKIDADTQKLAGAIEDLIYMEVIRFKDNDQNNKNNVTLSTPFTVILSNVISSMNLKRDNQEDVMRSMYFSFLIYMNEHLKIPKSFAMALGNDLERHRDEMESSELISNYVKILYNIFTTTTQGV
jgi:hypothetical protein